MSVRRWLLVGGLVWLCACSRKASLDGSSEGSELDGGTESLSDTGEPNEACASEWDCGVGERCIAGACACVGCGCPQPDEPGDEPDADPVWLDIVEPECWDDEDCAALEYCFDSKCEPTTACMDDLDCRADWPDVDRFCVEGLCRWQGCYNDGDLGCPEGALCNHNNCRWLEALPSCTSVPSFELVVAHTLSQPADAMVVIIDLDADGRDDLAVLEGGALNWLRSTGAGFGPPTAWAAEPGVELVTIGRGDVHGDGIAELLVARAGPPAVEILLASPAGPQAAGLVATSSSPSAIATLDVDYDGLPDLVVGSTIDGPGTLVEAQLGDGTGSFAPLWLDPVTPFEFIQPYPGGDEPQSCRRGLASIEPEFFGARRFERDGVAFGIRILVDRQVAGATIFAATESRADGHVATAALADRGVLFVGELGAQDQFIELAPDPAAVAVALLSDEHDKSYALVDHGAQPGEVVELSGSPLAPVCRDSLGFALAASELGVGDFDGDGREDLLGRGTDGVLRVWLSRD